jgi:hypothetical protein
MKKTAKDTKLLKEVYTLLVSFRKLVEERGDEEYAEEIEETYKNFWVRFINEKPPWH